VPEHENNPIERVSAKAYKIPTESPESDGTLEWDHTTIVIAEVEAGGQTGLGYTYCLPVSAKLINFLLGPKLLGRDVFAIEANWSFMNDTVRNMGRPGICSSAISAIDVAFWDAKAKLLNTPLSMLLPMARGSAPVYGSGGFTSYDEVTLCAQLENWAEQGCAWVKMKVGRDPARDGARAKAAKRVIGETQLFVDANGAYLTKQALDFAQSFAQIGVTWLEEPVSSDKLNDLRFIRERCPAQIMIAAGEYGYTPYYFRVMLAAAAVDVLQADATRCGGITGFMRASALCDAFQIPFSSHCAPAIHLAPALAAPRLEHMEWFHDHVRIEHMLFDGAPSLNKGHIAPDKGCPGHGLSLRKPDAARFEV
jgi:L-alanine-DL-glutamate epimerase-like enolase superfamily enzyme